MSDGERRGCWHRIQRRMVGRPMRGAAEEGRPSSGTASNNYLFIISEVNGASRVTDNACTCVTCSVT